MRDKDSKSEALVGFLKSQNSVFTDSWYDGIVVKAIRIDKVDVQILLSAQANERGKVKVGIYVDDPHYDTSDLHKRLEGTWAPNGTVREESKNWGLKRAGVQMWFRMAGINWVNHFDKVEMTNVIEDARVVYNKLTN